MRTLTAIMLIFMLLLGFYGIYSITYTANQQQNQQNICLGVVACYLPLAFGGSPVNSVNPYDINFKFVGVLNFEEPENSVLLYNVYDTYGNLLATGDDFGLLMRNVIAQEYCDFIRGGIFLSSGVYYLNSSHNETINDYGFEVKTGIKLRGENPSSTAILIGTNYTVGAILIPDGTWNVFIEELGFVEMPDVFTPVITSETPELGIGGIFIRWNEFFYSGGISIYMPSLIASGIFIDHNYFTSQRCGAVWIDALDVSNVQMTNLVVNFVAEEYWHENVTADTDLGHGLAVTQSDAGSTFKEVIIAQSNIRGTARHGVLLSGAEDMGLNISSQIDTVCITNCGQISPHSGVMLEYVSKVICMNGISEGNSDYGIGALGVTHSIVKGWILCDNTNGPIDLTGFDVDTCYTDNYIPIPET